MYWTGLLICFEQERSAIRRTAPEVAPIEHVDITHLQMVNR